MNLLFAVLLMAASEMKHAGQIRMMNRAEGVLVAVDEGKDGRVDHIYIALGAKRAVGFSGPGVVETDGTFVRVVPDDTRRPINQYYVGEAPWTSWKRGGGSTPVRGLAHYEGRVVQVPFAEIDSWPIPSVDGKEPPPPKLYAISGLGADPTGPYVGRVRVIPREGHVILAVDDDGKDGIVDTVVVAQTDQEVEPFEGRALVEVTDAGIRLVALEPKFQLVFSLAKPRAVQTRTGQNVAVPLAEIETLEPLLP